MNSPPKYVKPKPQSPKVETAKAQETLNVRRRQGYASTVVAGMYDSPAGPEKLGVK